MRYRIKLKVSAKSPSGGRVSEKLAFDLAPDQDFALSSKALENKAFPQESAFAVLRVLSGGDAPGLWVSAAAEAQSLELGGRLGERFKVVEGDQVLTSSGVTVEFVSVPAMRSEPAEAATRYIDASVLRPTDSITGWILKQGAVSTVPDVPQGGPVVSDWRHLGVSALRAAGASMLMAWIARPFEFDLFWFASVLLAGGAGALAVASLAWVAFRFRSTFDLGVSFQQLFRAFSGLWILLIPWAFTVHFPLSVGIYGAFLITAVWLFYFSIKYRPNGLRFVPAALLSVIAVMVAGHQALVFKPAATQAAQPVVAEAPSSAPAPEPAPVVAEVAVEAPAAAAPAAAAVPDQLAKEEFFAAVKAGQLERVRKLVDQRAVDVSFTLDDGGSTALHHAAAAGHYKLVKYLVSKRAPVNAKDPSGTTPLMWAVARKQVTVAAYLLSRKADPVAKRDDGATAIDLAIKLGRSAKAAPVARTLTRLLKDPKSAQKLIKEHEVKLAKAEAAKTRKLASVPKKAGKTQKKR